MPEKDASRQLMYQASIGTWAAVQTGRIDMLSASHMINAHPRGRQHAGSELSNSAGIAN